MFNIAQLSGLLTAALMMWSTGHLAMATNRVAQTGPPSLPNGEKPVATIEVAVEPIYEFDAYYINEVNPFVPYSKRQIERKRMWERRKRPNKAPEKVPEDKRPTPVPQKPIKLPELVLPTYNAGKENSPQVIGSVEMGDRYLVFVKLGEREQQMHAGDKIGDWTLVKMENGLVTFNDPDGEVLRVGAVNGENVNSIDGAAVEKATPANTGVTGALAPSTAEILELLKDPSNKQQVQEMLKNPKMKKMLMSPTVQKMLRENGLGHLVK